jgi:hypothetical protein
MDFINDNKGHLIAVQLGVPRHFQYLISDFQQMQVFIALLPTNLLTLSLDFLRELQDDED